MELRVHRTRGLPRGPPSRMGKPLENPLISEIAYSGVVAGSGGEGTPNPSVHRFGEGWRSAA